MPTDVALAVLFGALLHATWNTLVKASADKLTLTVLVCCAAGLWSIPAVLIGMKTAVLFAEEPFKVLLSSLAARTQL
ncbi:MAG: hypothetical protein K2W80_10460 [Burkholderiales bacterium]|nr:hypothetical protein [Burkholderiales bacterium]